MRRLARQRYPSDAMNSFSLLGPVRAPTDRSAATHGLFGRLVAVPGEGNGGRRWLPVWLPQHRRPTHVNGLVEPVRGPDLGTCLARSEGLEPPTF